MQQLFAQKTQDAFFVSFSLFPFLITTQADGYVFNESFFTDDFTMLSSL